MNPDYWRAPGQPGNRPGNLHGRERLQLLPIQAGRGMPFPPGYGAPPPVFPVSSLSPQNLPGPRTSTRLSSESSQTSVRSGDDLLESDSLRVVGLPPQSDADYIKSFIINQNVIAIKKGKQLVTVFDLPAGKEYKSARVTFTSIENAINFKNRWNKRCPPGSTNKLTVQFWEVKKTNKKTAEPVRPSNGIIIHGLPTSVTKEYLAMFISNIVRGKSNQPLARIFPAKNGFCSAQVILPTIEMATYYIENYNKKPLPGEKNNLTFDYYIDRNAKTPNVDKEIAKKIRQAAAVTTTSVIIKGLFNKCNEDYLLDLIGHEKVENGNKGKRLISIFGGHGSAKITFKTVAHAREFIEKYNKKTLEGQKNKLTVEFYLDREEPKTLADPLVLDKHTDKAKSVVRNVVYAQGIHKMIKDEDLSAIVEKEVGKKPHKVNIFRYTDGKSMGRGTISFKDAADAELCLNVLKGATFEGLNVSLQLSRFESTNIKRLPGAIGNDHLFGRNSTGYIYECLGCLDNWDERDMIGCVPIGHDAEDQTHFLCQECVRRNCEANKIDGKLGDYGTGFPCPEACCKRVLLWAPVNKVLTDRETAARIDRRMTDEALREIEGIEYCKEDCGYGAFLEHDPQRMQFYSCQNPACLSQYCRICKIPFVEHAGKSCDEVDPRRQQEKKDKRIAEEINEQLSRSKILICPKCSLRFTKDEDGSCNKMTCKCGTTMCYVCKMPNIAYDHFSNGYCNQNENTTEVDRRNYEKAYAAVNSDANMRGLLAAIARQ